jgi:hypothetical protein
LHKAQTHNYQVGKLDDVQAQIGGMQVLIVLAAEAEMSPKPVSSVDYNVLKMPLPLGLQMGLYGFGIVMSPSMGG